MNNIIRAFIVLTGIALVCPAIGKADIVYLKSEDRLYGTIQNPSFTIQTPYGKVLVRHTALKSVKYKNGSRGHWIIETINNDRFSGSLLDSDIRFKQEDGNQKTIKREQIKRMKREIMGPRQLIATTIFTMKNGDRFSGTFLNRHLEIRTNYMTKSIQAVEINRIEFMQDNQSNLKILLNNGDILEGTLKHDHFHLMPSAGSELNVTESDLKSIQFNAPKLVLQEFSGFLHAQKDSDGDGIPDFADLCMDTPAGVNVDMDGCAGRARIQHAATQQTTNGYRKDPAKLLAANSGQFPKILFDFGRAELNPRYFSELDEAAVMLKRSPLVHAEIHGHTDAVGTKEYNLHLSMRRARAVEQYLVNKGVERERLFSRGFGFTINAASNENENGRALNLRVEILLVPDQKN